MEGDSIVPVPPTAEPVTAPRVRPSRPERSSSGEHLLCAACREGMAFSDDRMTHWCGSCERLCAVCPYCDRFLTFVALCYLRHGRFIDVAVSQTMEDAKDPDEVISRLDAVLPGGWDDAEECHCRIVRCKDDGAGRSYAHLTVIPEDHRFLWHCHYCQKDVPG